MMAKNDAVDVRSRNSTAPGSAWSHSWNTSASVSSVRAPRPSEESVMPSWLAESMRPMFAMPCSDRRASRSPPRAIASSRVRRERTSANSTATKKPFRSSRTAIAAMRPSTTTKLCRTTHHHHAGAHHHHHLASDEADRSTRALRLALALTVVLLFAEAIGGWISNSLALLADAGHVLTDAGALALSLFVAWFSRQPVTPAKTYAYLRWEVLAALINGATLLGISVWIVIEAVMRLRAPEPVGGALMLIVATAGLLAYAVAAWLLHPTHDSSLNIRG